MLYDISDVCTIFGLTPSGVRYYEELGLIHPARTQGGRRKYSEEEMRRLLHIKTLRSYNVSLEDIRAYFLNNTTENGEAISDVLQEKIRQLELQLETLRASIESLAQYARQLGSSPETAFLSAREHQPAELCALHLQPLFGKTQREWTSLSRWLALVPSVRRCIHYRLSGGRAVFQSDCFLVEKSVAQGHGLPLLDRAELIPAAPCLQLCYQLPHNAEEHGLSAGDLAQLGLLARERGLGEETHLFATYLFGNIAQGARQKLYDLWLIAR